MADIIRIKMLTSVAGGGYTYQAGEEVSAPSERAVDLIKAKHAVPIDGKPAENAASKVAAKGEKR